MCVRVITRKNRSARPNTFFPCRPETMGTVVSRVRCGKKEAAMCYREFALRCYALQIVNEWADTVGDKIEFARFRRVRFAFLRE